MAKITWLGDEECLWNDVTFPAGVPVDTDDAYMIGKARNNPYFRLEENAAAQSAFGPMPEWIETAPEAAMAFEAMEPTPKRKRGRPPKVRDNADQ